MHWILAALGSVLAGLLGSLGAFGPHGGGPLETDPVPDGTVLVGSWSQSDHPGIYGRVGPSEVVETEAQRDDLLRRLRGPERLSSDELALIREVDLTRHVLVAGGFHRCTESGRVVADGDGAEATYRFEVTSGDPTVSCVWSPFTVVVYAVPRDSGPHGGTLVSSWSEGADPVVGEWRLEPVVVEDEAALAALVASSPSTLEDDVRRAVASVDLATQVVVAGGYARCTEHSEVGPGPSFEVVGDDDVSCDWAPWTVDLHVVPR